MGRNTVAGWCAPSSRKRCGSDLNRAPTPAQVSRSCGPAAGLHLPRRDIHQRCAERAWKNALACAEFLRSSQFSDCFWKIVWFSSHSRHFRSWQTGGITVLKTTVIAHVCQGTCMRNGSVFDAARCDTQLEDDATRRQHARLSLPATPVPLFQPSYPLQHGFTRAPSHQLGAVPSPCHLRAPAGRPVPKTVLAPRWFCETNPPRQHS